MRAEGETGDGGYLRALADVHPAQLPDDRPREHHVYPGHRHRGMDCVPSYPGCYPAHQGDGSGKLILYINICYSRLGDSVESLGRDLFFVKIVEILGCFGDLMYICNSLDSV